MEQQFIWRHAAATQPRSRPSVVITGIDSMAILDQAIEATDTFRPMKEKERTALLAKTAQAASTGEYELFKTRSIFDATAQNLEWLDEEPDQFKSLMPS